MANKISNLKFVQTIKNIWKVEDLRVRIGITLLFVAIYRFGSQIVLPGIDTVALIESSKLADQTKGGLMSLLDMFSGGAFSNASIFALGIMPYISASIVLQLLALAVPYFVFEHTDVGGSLGTSARQHESHLRAFHRHCGLLSTYGE